MEEKKAIKISFSTALLVIALIIICIMSFYIYDINNNTNISDNGSSNNMSVSNSNSNNLFDTISYITIEIADTQSGSYDGTYLKPVTISDTNIINKFIDMTSKCEKYTNFYDEFGAGDYFEGNPIVIIHQTDGKTFYLTASDNFHIDDEVTTNIVDIKTINNYSKENESFSNEVVYKINSNFEAFINETYNSNK